jgi:precorrin-6B methylase 2
MGDNERRKIKCKSYLHYHDEVSNSVAPLNSAEMMNFMEIYRAENGATDPLGRNNHILKKYDVSLLPDLILSEKKFRDFFIPENQYETILELLQNNPEISTDKNSIKYYDKSLEWDFMQYHSYIDNFYNEEFKKYKNKNISLCEIGIDTGGSIAIWSKYFPDSNIIGIDNNTSRLKDEYKSYNFDNVRYIIDNAYDSDLVKSLPNFDIIIDDGPHTFESQKEFIQLYSSKLNPGGVMIIEDVKSIDYIEEFNKILMPGYTSEFIDLTVTDNLYDSILYIIRK